MPNISSQNKAVSVVMCTYNGGRCLREQLDSVVGQTYPPHEIIIQDDGSTDDTLQIVSEYAQRYPVIKVFSNEGTHGFNPNFYSAMQRATGDYIAICDQDDIWELNKIERQMEAIGTNLLCTHRSKPFSDDGSSVHYDPRTPNVGMLRLLYASLPGHTQLFRRDLLRLAPDMSSTFYGTAYDVILAITAAAYERLVLIDEVLVHQRRYASAATYIDVDHHRTAGYGNGLYMLKWSLRHFRQVKPLMVRHFERRLRMVELIQADTRSQRQALKMLRWQASDSWLSLFRLQWFFVRHRSEIFFAKGHDPQNLLRAALFPVLQVYNYQYLLIKK